ncbi:hypothetical protein I553_8181 [Mycobacterium xenopi 4042]|uniref:DUF8174 domain-containing protein n=1 Tax=Mycobacterium xenopi 4042 TaxID=1299334 RepID=X8DEC9_MYCXE|nr:hypothetical protein I553_8181 [Mycobacterium xenopi 4042]
MAGPNHGVGADGPPHTEPTPVSRFPATGLRRTVSRLPRRVATAGAVPEAPPPRLIVGAVAALALIAAMTAAIVYGTREQRSATTVALSDATAKTAIQGYLDALENRDIETIARNTLCGIYDAVRDRRSDQALAKLSSDAFRKQFASAQVISIDKIVYWSNYQAQVLFTMRVRPATGGPRATRCKAWRSCCSSTARCWCARMCCGPPAPISRSTALVERVAARARTSGVGVVDREALFLDGVDEVDRGALQVRGAHPVHGQGDATELRGQVAVEGAVIEEQVVAQARAAARLNRDPQRQVVASFLVQQ